MHGEKNSEDTGCANVKEMQSEVLGNTVPLITVMLQEV